MNIPDKINNFPGYQLIVNTASYIANDYYLQTPSQIKFDYFIFNVGFLINI